MGDSQFNINNDYSSFRDNHLNAINELLSIENYESKDQELKTGLEIAYYLFYVSSETDLGILIEGLKIEKLLFDFDIVENKIKQTLQNKEYTKFQETRIKAIVYSGYITHSILKYQYGPLFQKGVGMFDFLIHQECVITTLKTFKEKLIDRLSNNSFNALDNVDNKSQTDKDPPGRVLIGVYFLTGKADEKYKELGSWRKVAEHFKLQTFSGQFSSTANKNSTYNENDVFHTNQIEILGYINKNRIDIKRMEYIRPE
ncbi:hypothetical protein [Arenibacter certesii]|uniref:Uncharacterized protein n=1 Tax=Arenibacter certesii TaxID=228955 RepID=A0A918J0J5_9FLAO|nr:hypothetical protein [Arenibacter certesii]GGW37255.1 hypothetical protein GCM10007383_22640 [Arenibacter certesii]